MKKAQRLFIMLFIFQILLNCCSYILGFEIFNVHNHPKYLPLGWFFCGIGAVNSIFLFIFSVKAKSKVIIFMFIYWYIALFTQYNHLYMILPLSFYNHFIAPLLIPLFQTWYFLLIPKLSLWGKPLYSILTHFIFVVFTLLSLIFLIKFFVCRHKY